MFYSALLKFSTRVPISLHAWISRVYDNHSRRTRSPATTVRLLDHFPRHHDPEVTRLDLTLPEPSAVDVLPLTIELQGFLKDGAQATRNQAWFQYVDVSDDGQVRGFFGAMPCQDDLETENDHIMKCIDTTRDQWVIACGKLSPVVRTHIAGAWTDGIVTFDGMRGSYVLLV